MRNKKKLEQLENTMTNRKTNIGKLHKIVKGASAHSISKRGMPMIAQTDTDKDTDTDTD